jgi:hypothetical protein
VVVFVFVVVVIVSRIDARINARLKEAEIEKDRSFMGTL